LTFMLTYLSWEGSGFMLPALIVVILALRWGWFDWMSDWHLWRCFLVVSALVIIQLCYRQVVKPADYLGIVYDLSELTTPAPVFLNRLLFAPYYYAGVLFFSENNLPLSLLLLIGVAFAWRNAAIRYLFISLMTLGLLLTCLLPHYAPRYSFSWLALLVLASVGVCFTLLDNVAALAIRLRPAMTPTAIAPCVSCFSLLLLLLAANPFLLKLYRLSSNPSAPAVKGRLGKEFNTNYRAVARYLSQHRLPADGLVARASAILDFYGRKPVDYAMNTMLTDRLTYDGGTSTPQFIDKFFGAPTIRNLEELRAAESRYPRLWVVVLFSDNSDNYDDFDVLDYLHKRGQVMFEAYHVQLVLLPGTQDMNGTASR